MLVYFSLSSFSGLRAADTISPKIKEVSESEGKSVTLSCDYDTTSNNVLLLWYRHDSDLQAPQLLLSKGARSWSHLQHNPDKRYESQTTRSLTEMTIRELTLADSAVYYCALHTVIQSVEEAVQKPEHTDLPRLQRGGKWDSNHRFLSDGFWSFRFHQSRRGYSCWWETVWGFTWAANPRQWQSTWTMHQIKDNMQNMNQHWLWST